MPRKQIHLAAHFPGVNNTTVWSDPRSGSHIEFSSFVHLAQTAERAKFDFLFLAEGLRLREQGGEIYDLDVVGRPDTFTVLAALAAVTDRLGLAGTINSTFNEPYEVARQFASLDHLSGGRAAWNVVTSWDAFTGENFRRGGFLPQEQRYERARTFLETAWQLFDSWDGDRDRRRPGVRAVPGRSTPGPVRAPRRAVRASPASSTCRAARRAGRSSSRPATPMRAASSPRPARTRSSAGTASCADGQAFYADVKRRLARYGRRPDELLILPAATFVLADTDAEAQELAREVRLQQVSGQTAIKFAEQLWNRDLSGLRPGRPAARLRPGARREHDRPRPGQRPDVPRPRGHRPAVAGQGRGGAALAPRADHRGDRPAVVRRLGGHGRRRPSTTWSRRTPATGSSWCRTSPRAAWTSSPTRWCRCYRNAACSAPSTPATRCGSTWAWPRCRATPGPAPGGRHDHRRWPCSTWSRSAPARPRPRRCATASTWPSRPSGSATPGTGSPSTT